MDTDQKIDALEMHQQAENHGRPADSCIMVIFGAAGDLTTRKLIPALYNLGKSAHLPKNFAIVGFAVDAMTDDQFREKMRESVEKFSEDTKLDDDVWAAFARGLFYVAGDIGDAGLYQRLGEKLAQIESERHTGGNALFYLSTQPSQYAPIAHGIGGAGLGKGSGWRRLVVEKPFGHDLASARELSDRLHEVFDGTLEDILSDLTDAVWQVSASIQEEIHDALRRNSRCGERSSQGSEGPRED